ncbi:FAD-dependent oxidoreductase [Arthrobacter ginkgonis]|uniref:FAD-dependent oxidoreductase n=1 Tax=Arthrobacter ginkgonis TaxID=1630594 RepID=A0ABP7CCU0_9MICC
MASADRVVIIGSGHAGVSVAAGLRTRGFSGRIVLVDGEPGLPYERPPLSKELLKPGAPDGATPLRKESYFEGKDIERIAGATAVSIDRARGMVALSDGREVGYSRLVLATGSRPRLLSVPGADLPGLFTLKTFEDGRALKQVLAPGARVVIVGAGYIGLEVAAAAAKLGCDTTILEFQDRIMSRVTSEPVSRFFEQVHRANGVRISFGTAVTALGGDGRVEFVATADGTRYPADVVVAGIGVVPNQDLAEAAGLECSDGVLVDDAGRTSAEGIYAAGDATRFASLFDGASQRLECIQNAQSQADRIAADITGQEPGEPGVPWFWTVQHGVRLQTAGVRHPDDETVVRGEPATGRFSVVYLRDGRISAVDTIGGLSDFNPGKRLVAERATLDAALVADPGTPLADSAVPALAPSR